jgi:hypothetical protein
MKFKKLNTTILSSTLNEWGIQANKLGDIGVLLVADIERKLEWAMKHEKSDSASHTYCLLDENECYARSVVEITQVLPKSDNARLKLLDITLEPNLNVEAKEEGDAETFKETFDILSQSIVESLSLIFSDLPSSELKIYGRTDRMAGMFDRMRTSGKLDDVLARCGLSVRQECKWLVFYKK